MAYLAQLYVNTTLAGTVLFALLAVWSIYLALRGRALISWYGLALLSGEAVLALVIVVQLGRWLTGAVIDQLGLSLVYGLLALGTIPGIWVYIEAQPPRQKAFSMALACLFVSGMVLRALQTGITA